MEDHVREKKGEERISEWNRRRRMQQGKQEKKRKIRNPWGE